MDTPSLQAAGEAILPPALKAEMPLSQSVEVAKLQTFRKSLRGVSRNLRLIFLPPEHHVISSQFIMGMSQNWVPQ